MKQISFSRAILSRKELVIINPSLSEIISRKVKSNNKFYIRLLNICSGCPYNIERINEAFHYILSPTEYIEFMNKSKIYEVV